MAAIPVPLSPATRWFTVAVVAVAVSATFTASDTSSQQATVLLMLVVALLTLLLCFALCLTCAPCRWAQRHPVSKILCNVILLPLMLGCIGFASALSFFSAMLQVHDRPSSPVRAAKRGKRRVLEPGHVDVVFFVFLCCCVLQVTPAHYSVVSALLMISAVCLMRAIDGSAGFVAVLFTMFSGLCVLMFVRLLSRVCARAAGGAVLLRRGHCRGLLVLLLEERLRQQR